MDYSTVKGEERKEQEITAVTEGVGIHVAKQGQGGRLYGGFAYIIHA